MKRFEKLKSDAEFRETMNFVIDKEMKAWVDEYDGSLVVKDTIPQESLADFVKWICYTQEEVI